LPAPLGSLPALFRPPTLAGPDGTPLTPAVPAPAEPALGDPAALPVPPEGPLAAPPALPPPPAPPPALCANELTGPRSSATAMIDGVTDILVIARSPLWSNDNACCWFRNTGWWFRAGTISVEHYLSQRLLRRRRKATRAQVDRLR
jgi:hypothetical protein